MRAKPAFHPDAPRRLVKLWNEYPAYYRIAQYLDVNRATVWFALKQGKEPRNETIREKFGLPRKRRKQYARSGKERVYLPDYLKWWRNLDPDMRNVYIRETFENWSSLKP